MLDQGGELLGDLRQGGRGEPVPPITKTDQNFEKTDQYQTLFESKNRPIPDLSHLNTGPYDTNNRPIPDQTMVMYDKYIGSVILTP